MQKSDLQAANAVATYHIPKCVTNSKTGSWAAGAWVNSFPNVPVHNCSVWGDNSGVYLWHGYTFSDVIKDRDKVSMWDCFTAGMKEQFYANPIGTLGTTMQVGAVGLGLLGNLSNALAGLCGNNNQ